MAAVLSAASHALVIHGAGSAGRGLAAVSSSPFFFLGVTGAFAACLWAWLLVEGDRTARSPAALAIVLGAAAALRLIALPATPVLSDDVYRYMWDGHVQTHGVSPYAHPPMAPQLDGIATPYRSLINHPGLPTIYPPVSQLVFLLSALAGGGLAEMKILLILFDLGTVLVLVAVLRQRGAPPSRVVLYAWSPLAVLEIGWSGHQDSIGVFLMAVAVLAIVRGRRGVSVTAAALSGAAKYIGWLVLPVAARRARWTAWLSAAAALGLACAPYVWAGAGVTGSLLTYAEIWRFNDSLFGLIHAGVEWTGLSAGIHRALEAAGWLAPDASWEISTVLRLTAPLSLAKALAAAVFLAFAVRTLRRPWEDPLRKILSLVGGALLLSPTLHPWYLLWVAPLMVAAPRVAWIWLTYAVVVFSYPMMASRTGGGEPLGWLAWPEYLPFFVMLAVESARRRLWEVDGEGWSRIV